MTLPLLPLNSIDVATGRRRVVENVNGMVLRTGDWTPTDVSGAGLTFGASTDGSYIQIQNLIIARFRIDFPTTTSGASALISGMPFMARGMRQSMRQGNTSYNNSGSTLYTLVDDFDGYLRFYTDVGTGTEASNLMLSNV